MQQTQYVQRGVDHHWRPFYGYTLDFCQQRACNPSLTSEHINYPATPVRHVYTVLFFFLYYYYYFFSPNKLNSNWFRIFRYSYIYRLGRLLYNIQIGICTCTFIPSSWTPILQRCSRFHGPLLWHRPRGEGVSYRPTFSVSARTYFCFLRIFFIGCTGVRLHIIIIVYYRK